jgi:hypothetical protein
MPIGLIVFGDKSHTDLLVAFSLKPIIFTLTLSNQNAHNNPNFWRSIGYIPNITYGKDVADKTLTRDKIQDEHVCLSYAFKSLRKISKEKGFETVVLGRNVYLNVWIHYFIGDTEGNNKWLGQYPGNREGVKRPYQDCKCNYQQLSNPNFNCEYITKDDVALIGKRRKREDEDGGHEYHRSISRYDINNA